MQIDTNDNSSQTPRVGADAPAGAGPVQPSGGCADTSQQIKALNLALRGEADVRPDKVEKAIRLIGQAQWPTRGTVWRLSALLAARMSERME